MAVVRRVAGAVLVLALLVSLPGGASWTVSANAAGIEDPTSAQSAEIDPDSVLLEIELQPDGDARWTVEYRTYLDDENESAAFDDLRDSIAADPDHYTDRFAEGIEESVRVAESDTGRAMDLENVSVSTSRQSIGQPTGIVRYTFAWTGFVIVEDDRISAGDAIDRFFVDEETRLVVTVPAEYAFTSATPEPDDDRDRVVVWEGPTTFASGEPRVEAAPVDDGSGDARSGDDGPSGGVGDDGSGDDGSTGGDGETGGDDESPGVDGADSGGGPLVFGVTPRALVVALAVIALLAATTVWYASRRDGASTSGSVDPDAADSREPPTELLSNEEQVLRVLERNGGRVKQQELVEACGWSDSKTSKVVSQLREEGRVEAFRLGRENVVSLPSETIDDGGTHEE